MNTPKEYTYAPGSAKLRDNCKWFEIRYGFKAEEMIEFCKAHANEKGFVNLKINERRTVGKFGETHNVSLDTWMPTKQAQPAQQPPSQSDDVPF